MYSVNAIARDLDILPSVGIYSSYSHSALGTKLGYLDIVSQTGYMRICIPNLGTHIRIYAPTSAVCNDRIYHSVLGNNIYYIHCTHYIYIYIYIYHAIWIYIYTIIIYIV